MAEAPEGFDVTESARIIGCWKGLLDQGRDNGTKLKNAVAFCSTIEESKRIVSYFQETVDAYIDYEHEHGVDLRRVRRQRQLGNDFDDAEYDQEPLDA